MPAMSVKRLFLVIGIICVMAAMVADVWLTRQQAEVLGGKAFMGPGRAGEPALGSAHTRLPAHYAGVTVLASVGWVIIAASLGLILAEVFSPSCRYRYRR